MSSSDSLNDRRAALAAYLRVVAAECSADAPATADQFINLARQAEHDPTAIVSPRLDTILALAEDQAPLGAYTVAELHDAVLRAQALRHANAVNWTQMRRYDAIRWTLYTTVVHRERNAGMIVPVHATAPSTRPSRTDDLNARRRPGH